MTQGEIGARGAQRTNGSSWDTDAPAPAAGRRATRAAAVVGVWVVAVWPVALGWQRCSVATIFHRPCPGCGVTRALRLLMAGQLDASLRMHPFAVPVLAVGVSFVVSTVWATWKLGSPLRLLEGRFARVVIFAAVVTYAATFALWILRWFGYFGGPVTV